MMVRIIEAQIVAKILKTDNTAYHCMYVFRWTYLIDKYNLSANQVDKDKIREVIGECDLN